MKVSENNSLTVDVLNNIKETVLADREGIHLSDLIYCIRKPFWKNKGLTPKPTTDQAVLWLTGFAFQAYMFPHDEEVTNVVEGIYCTPDIPSGIEVKSTRMSAGKFNPEDMNHWIRQMMGYCYVLEKTEYDLVVMFVCGDYKPPFPSIKSYHFEFTTEEIIDNWNMITDNRDKLLQAYATDTPPEPNPSDWEWQYCECIDNCPDTECYRKKQLKEMRKKK